MTGQIGDDKIHEVRDRVDIIDLVSSYVSLKRAGANHMGLCPFHSEKSPSFSVHAGRQFFHCFGCGVGGDAFSFLMKMEGLSFPEAVRRLAERAGVEIEEQRLSPEDERRLQEREQLFRVNEMASGYFHRLLMNEPEGEPGRQYLKGRGYGQKAAREYQLGFAAEAWEGLSRYLVDSGVDEKDARTLGLIRPGKDGRSSYDLFRGRLIFPIHNLAGKVVAFGGRILDDGKPKYINSPESPIYHKGQVLFGLYQARQAMRQNGEVILVEGYFDQLALHRSGYLNSVATCGTALTGEHARLLKRYVQRVLLLFDQDSAGRQATFKAMEILQAEGLPAAVIDLTAGEDPDSFLRKQGSDVFQQRLDEARPALEVFSEEVLEAADPGVEGTVRAASLIVDKLAGLTSDLEQDLYLKQLAETTGINLELLAGKLAEAKRKRAAKDSRTAPREPGPRAVTEGAEPPSEPTISVEPAASRPRSFHWDKEEKIALQLLIWHEESRRLIQQQGIDIYFASGRLRKVAARLLEILGVVAAGDEEAALADLNAEQKDFLQPVLVHDADFFDGRELDMLEGCRKAVEKNSIRKRVAEVQQQMQVAEEEGNDEEMAELLREFTRLNKQLN